MHIKVPFDVSEKDWLVTMSTEGRQARAWCTEKRDGASSRRRPVLPQRACVTSDKLGPLARIPEWVLNAVPNWLHAHNSSPHHQHQHLLFLFFICFLWTCLSARFCLFLTTLCLKWDGCILGTWQAALWCSGVGLWISLYWSTAWHPDQQRLVKGATADNEISLNKPNKSGRKICQASGVKCTFTLTQNLTILTRTFHGIIINEPNLCFVAPKSNFTLKLM